MTLKFRTKNDYCQFKEFVCVSVIRGPMQIFSQARSFGLKHSETNETIKAKCFRCSSLWMEEFFFTKLSLTMAAITSVQCAFLNVYMFILSFILIY